MKKIMVILCLMFMSVLLAQEPVKYKAVSLCSVERSGGKKGFTAPVKTDAVIVFDIGKKMIAIYGADKRVFRILEPEPVAHGADSLITRYKCMDENKKECSLSFFVFSKPNKNGVLQQLFVSYPNTEYVYDMNLE